MIAEFDWFKLFLGLWLTALFLGQVWFEFFHKNGIVWKLEKRTKGSFFQQFVSLDVEKIRKVANDVEMAEFLVAVKHRRL